MQSVTKAVKPVPEGYHTVTPYLTIEGVPKLIDFLKEVFHAEEKERVNAPDGRVTHAELKIGDSIVMMGEASGEWKPMPSSIYVYIADTDAAYKRALAAGATSLREPTDEFYGDRMAGVKDRSGNFWWIATHVEDVPPEEMQQRMKARYSQ